VRNCAFIIGITTAWWAVHKDWLQMWSRDFRLLWKCAKGQGTQKLLLLLLSLILLLLLLLLLKI